ncbi:hypothetical protein [Amnibacterium endophyticum]|uniref:Integral membrane protein n=1 Tax=Amnibacterium endophyticum TaxID=2109337 RepID=A0ABW4L9N9_9MICO
MQLIYAESAAILLGFALHGLLPGRAFSGVLLLPAVAGAACAIVWVALTWAGVGEGLLIWAASLGAAVLSAAGLGVPLRRSRRRTEQERLAAVA